MFLKNLIPYPRKVKQREGAFCIDGSVKSRIVGKAERSYSFWLSQMNILKEEKSNEDSEIYAIVIGNENIPLPEFVGKEAFAISVSSKGIAISAYTEDGLSQGLKSLIRIYKLQNPIPALLINDEPMIDMRGIHMCVFDPEDGSEKDDTSPDAVKGRIELAALLGYNHVFIEFWGMFPYERHPYACWPHTTYTKAKIEEIISFCINDLHITPCPCQNLTSHAGWSRISTRRHVVLDQRPDLSDMWTPGGWCFATENPKTKKYLQDVMDELLEAFHNPPMFHMSCDKAFGFGSTEEDRTKSADVLFAQHIANLNTYLCSKGVRPVMWSDMLYTSMDSLTFKCAPFVADVLPKNILMNIWTHNDPGEYWNDIEYFESRGYETVYSPFNNYDSITNMIKLCLKHGSKGLVQTTWYAPERSKPYFAYSIAKQWNFDAEVNKEAIDKLLD